MLGLDSSADREPKDTHSMVGPHRMVGRFGEGEFYTVARVNLKDTHRVRREPCKVLVFSK